jgi:hypothetical protein
MTRPPDPDPRRRPARRTLDDLRPHVRDGRYRLGPHAVRHAHTEGFDERDVVMTLLHGRELARYLDDHRLLVLGWLPVSAAVRLPLHVVAAYDRPRWVDVVTAFVPRDPHRVISRRRLAELLRHDRAEPVARTTGPRGRGERERG